MCQTLGISGLLVTLADAILKVARKSFAEVAKQADALRSGRSARYGRGSSNLPFGTTGVRPAFFGPHVNSRTIPNGRSLVRARGKSELRRAGCLVQTRAVGPVPADSPDRQLASPVESNRDQSPPQSRAGVKRAILPAAIPRRPVVRRLAWGQVGSRSIDPVQQGPR